MTMPDQTVGQPCSHDDMPQHVAIIMDGNGRWAAERELSRSEGHRHGVESVRGVVRAAIEMGLVRSDGDETKVRIRAINTGALVEAVVAFGARHTEAGEFTKRAYLNGNLDLAQAEAIADLIGSGTRQAWAHGCAEREGRGCGQGAQIHCRLADRPRERFCAC